MCANTLINRQALCLFTWGKDRKQSYLWHSALCVCARYHFHIRYIVGTRGWPGHRTGHVVLSQSIHLQGLCHIFHFSVLQVTVKIIPLLSDDGRIERRSVEGIGKLKFWCLGHIFFLFNYIEGKEEQWTFTCGTHSVQWWRIPGACLVIILSFQRRTEK